MPVMLSPNTLWRFLGKLKIAEELENFVCLFLFQFLFQQLGVIIAIIRQYIKNHLDDIFDMIKVWLQILYFCMFTL